MLPDEASMPLLVSGIRKPKGEKAYTRGDICWKKASRKKLSKQNDQRSLSPPPLRIVEGSEWVTDPTRVRMRGGVTFPLHVVVESHGGATWLEEKSAGEIFPAKEQQSMREDPFFHPGKRA
jgi:hypothetical protein